MPTTCHGTLKAYGDPVHAERARDRIAAIFGPPLRNDSPFEASWRETGRQVYDALLEVMDEAGQ